MTESIQLTSLQGVPTSDDRTVVANRILNVAERICEAVLSGSMDVDKGTLSSTDSMFMLETLITYEKKQVFNALTPEKEKQLLKIKSKEIFLDGLKKNGGVYSTTEAARILGVSKVTVLKWVKSGNLLSIEIDGKFLFPAFQFSEKESISNKGVLILIGEIIKALNKKEMSDRMKYSFFVRPIRTVLNGFSNDGNDFTIVDIIKSNPSPELKEEIFRLVRLYGTQDAA